MLLLGPRYNCQGTSFGFHISYIQRWGAHVSVIWEDHISIIWDNSLLGKTLLDIVSGPLSSYIPKSTMLVTLLPQGTHDSSDPHMLRNSVC